MQYLNMTIVIFTGIVLGLLIVPCSEFFINKKKSASNFEVLRRVYLIAICTTLNSLGWFIAYILFKFSSGQALLSLLISISLVISIIDLKIRIIPNELVLLYLAVALVFHLIGGESITLVSHIQGMACGFGLFFLGDVITGGGKVGAGDIKLAGAIGFITGFPGVLPTLLIASVSVSLICGFMIYKGKIKRETPVPYAPFITAGLISAVALKDIINAVWIMKFINI